MGNYQSAVYNQGSNSKKGQAGKLKDLTDEL